MIVPTVVTAVNVDAGFNSELTEVSKARAEVFKLVPAFAVTVPEMGWVAGKFDTETLPETGWVTPLPSTGTRPDTKAGVFVSIELREELPVVCNVEVEAPVGKGNEVADTGCVTPEPSTGSLVATKAMADPPTCVKFTFCMPEGVNEAFTFSAPAVVVIGLPALSWILTSPATTVPSIETGIGLEVVLVTTTGLTIWDRFWAMSDTYAFLSISLACDAV